MRIFALLIIHLLFTARLLACALCAQFTPTAHVSFDGELLRWDFSSNFTKVLEQGYDLDGDGVFSDAEMKGISDALLDYLQPRDYLLELAFYDLPLGASKRLQARFSQPQVSFERGQLRLSVRLHSDFQPRAQRVLRMKFYDEDGFFRFIINASQIAAPQGLAVRANVNIDAAFYEFYATDADTATATAPAVPAATTDAPATTTTAPSVYSSLLAFVAHLQNELFAALKSHSLLLYPLAFAYGAAHALLPSHGKSFSAAYFASRRRGAALFALKVGFAHLASSALAAAIFGTLAALRMGFASGYFVAAMAFALIFIRLARPKFRRIQAAKSAAQMPTPQRFATIRQPSRITQVLRSRQTADWLAAILLGLFPCPGMVLALGLLAPFGLAALGAAVCIALGMAASIFFCAHLAGRFKLSERGQIAILALVGCLALLLAMSEV